MGAHARRDRPHGPSARPRRRCRMSQRPPRDRAAAPRARSSVRDMNGWKVLDESDVLRLGAHGGGVRGELPRPGSLNAFDDRLAIELLEALRRLGADDAVRAIVLTGTGRAF